MSAGRGVAHLHVCFGAPGGMQAGPRWKVAVGGACFGRWGGGGGGAGGGMESRGRGLGAAPAACHVRMVGGVGSAWQSRERRGVGAIAICMK